MTLNSIEFDHQSVAIPDEIAAYLRAVDALVQQHRINTAMKFRGFVPSDYAAIYRCLQAVFDSRLLCGNKFCEWGSGIGVVASLAAMIGYESCGIEYDADLCAVAAGIREEFGVPVDLVHGSFVPEGVEDLIDTAFTAQDGELALHTAADLAYEDLGCDVGDFDLIFTYPWPNDVELTHEIFDRCAARGALLLLYYDVDSIDLYRKS